MRTSPFLLPAALGLAVAIAGCAAPQPAPQQASGGRPLTRLQGLYRAGRFAELEDLVARNQVQAEQQDPALVGLLLAAQGQVEAGLGLLEPLLSSPPAQPPMIEGLCLPLRVAQIQFYRRGDVAAAARALAADTGGCAGEEGTALRTRLAALGGGQVWALSGPPGEVALNLDKTAANAGYLVVRVIFDREHSGQFLISTGQPDVIIGKRLAAALRLRPGGGPWSAVPQLRVGLFLARQVPVLIADLSGLREKFQKRITRDVELDGILPLQRLLPRGYLRLAEHGTALRVAGDGGMAGPCRLQYPYHTGLYQQAGVLAVSVSTESGPPRLFGLDLGWRRSLVRQSARMPIEPGESDPAHPVITEPEVTRRVAEITLGLGQAALHMRHVPLAPSEAPRPGLAQTSGVIATDVPAEFDMMADLGEGRLYLAPPGTPHCAQ